MLYSFTTNQRQERGNQIYTLASEKSGNYN